jgi:hypothetical protein
MTQILLMIGGDDECMGIIGLSGYRIIGLYGWDVDDCGIIG